MKVSVFWGLILVSQPWRWYHRIWSACVVPKRFWLLAFKVSLRRTLQLHVKYWPPPKRQSLQGWGVFWSDGLDFPRVWKVWFSSTWLQVIGLSTTMVWTSLVLPRFLSAKESLVGWAHGAQPGFEMSFWVNLIIEAKISALPSRKILKNWALLGALKDTALNWW